MSIPWYANTEAPPSPVLLLVSRQAPLQQFLQEPLFFTQLQALNPKLQEYVVSSPKFVRRFINLLVEFNPRSQDLRSHKLSFLCQELMDFKPVCLAMAFFKSSQNQQLPIQILFQYINKPICDDDSLTSAYFLKAINFLLQTAHVDFLEFIYKRPLYLNRLVRLSSDHKLCQSLQFILNVEASKETKEHAIQRVALRVQIIQELFKQLRTNLTQDSAQNISIVLCESIQRQSIISCSHEMLQKIGQAQNIELLLEMTILNNSTISMAGCAVLKSLLQFLASSELNQEHIIYEFPQEKRHQLQKIYVVKKLVQYIPKIVLKLQEGPFSLRKLKIIELISTAVKINSLQIFSALKKAEWFQWMLHKFFQLEKVNVFHQLVQKQLEQFFTVPKAIFLHYLQYFFCQMDILDLTAKFMGPRPETQFLTERKKNYFGHLMKIVNIYSRLQTNNERIIKRIGERALLWNNLTIYFHKPYNQIIERELGSLQISITPLDFTKVSIENVPKKAIGKLLEREASLQDRNMDSVQEERINVKSEPTSPLDKLMNFSPPKLVLLHHQNISQFVLKQAKPVQASQVKSPLASPDFDHPLTKDAPDNALSDLPAPSLFQIGEPELSKTTVRPSLLTEMETRLKNLSSSSSNRRTSKSPSPFSKRQKREMWKNSEARRESPAKKEQTADPTQQPPSIQQKQTKIQKNNIDHLTQSQVVFKDVEEDWTTRLARSAVSLSNVRVQVRKGENGGTQRVCRRLNEKDRALLDFLAVKYN